MKHSTKQSPRIAPQARWGVIRSVHVTASGVFPKTLPYIVEADGSCWRPGEPFANYTPDAHRALRRNAEHAASLGIFAEEKRRAA